MARPAMSISIESAQPHTAEPAAKNTRAHTNSPLRPIMSPSDP